MSSTKGTFRTLSLAAASAAALLSGASTAHAQQTGQVTNEAVQVQFNIPAQPLASALTDFSRQARVTVVAPNELVRGRQSAGVVGEMSAGQALERLIAGSGLRIQRTSDGGLGLVAENETSPTQLGAADAASGADEEIVVIGTNIRGARPVGSPIQVYSRDDIETSGAGTVAAFVETIPQNFASEGQDTQWFGNTNNAEAASGINLRGLGGRATLVLLNGHRLAPGVLGEFVDISALPVAAMDRIEVLPDGASAIYGSDAVAGVVNFVLRDDYEGAESRVRYGALADSGASEFSASQSMGLQWGSGGVLGSLSYRHQDPLLASERDFTLVPDPYYLRPERETVSALISARQDLSPDLRLRGDVYYSSSDTFALTTLSFSPTATSKSHSEQFAVSASAALDLSEHWVADATVALAGNTLDRLYNQPAGTGRQTLDYSALVSSLDIRVNGPLFRGPAGPVRMALGAGLRQENYERDTSSLAAQGIHPKDFTRDAESLFAEFHVPLVSPTANIPGVNRLEFSVAGRYENYSDFGDTTNPKVGVLWELTPGFSLRGTYSTSFNVSSYNRTLTDSNVFFIRRQASPACAPAQCLIIYEQGRREAYDPEISESYTLGFDFSPAWLSGFDLSGSYYEILYEDRIDNLPSRTVVLANLSAFPGVWIADPSPAFVADFMARCTATPNCQNLVGAFDPSTVDYYLDLRATNLAHTSVRGIDLEASYHWSWGDFGLDARVAGTHILEHTNQLTSVSVPFDGVDRFNFPTATRVRTTFGLSRDRFSAFATWNWANEYTNDHVTPPGQIDSWSTVDLQLRLGIGDLFGADRDATHLSLSVVNLLNKEPPTAFDPTFPLNYDPANSSAEGRLVALELVQRW